MNNTFNLEEFDKDEFYSKIGENVAKKRCEKGISQLELSFRMGYKSVSLVSSAEKYTRKRHFNLEHIYIISKILDVSLSELMDFNS